MELISRILFEIAQHFGALVAVIGGIYLVVAYSRGELKAFFAFAYELLSGADGKPSSKNCGYFMGAAVLCWGFAKMTLAICRRIDAPGSQFDPSMIYLVLLSAITALVGAVVVASSAIQAKLQAKLNAPPDAGTTQVIGDVGTLTQTTGPTPPSAPGA